MADQQDSTSTPVQKRRSQNSSHMLPRRHTLAATHIRTSGHLDQSPVMRRNTVRTVESGPEQHAWAGGAAGLVAGLLLYPAETVSMRYKVGAQSVLKNLVLTEGPLALWSGVGAGLIGTIPSTAIYFVCYESFKAVGERNLQPSAHPIVHMVSGGMSEFISSVVYVPFEVVKARMMLGKNPHKATNGAISVRTNYPNSLVALYKIATTEGTQGLYAGYGPCLITDMSFRGLQFMLYELGKKKLIESRGGEIVESSVEDLALGAVTGAAAAFVTNPFDVLTVRVMTRGMDGAVSSRAIETRLAVSKLMAAFRRDGFRVLLDGAFYRCAALAPHSAVTFAVFEWVLRFFDPDRRNPKRFSSPDS